MDINADDAISFKNFIVKQTTVLDELVPQQDEEWFMTFRLKHMLEVRREENYKLRYTLKDL